MNRKLIGLLLLLGISQGLFAQKTIVLENAALRAEFDLGSGALVRFENRQSGWNAVERPELGKSFQMLIPLPERRFNNAYGAQQAAPGVKKEGNSVTFTWEGIRSEGLDKTLPIRFTGRIALEERGLVYSGTLENRSEFPVEYLCWPWFGELAPPDRDGEMVWQSLNYGQSQQRQIYPQFWTPKGYWGIDYPTQTWMLPECGFLLVRSEQQGFCVIADDPDLLRPVQCIFELIPGALTGNHTGGTVPRTPEVDGIPVRIEFKTNHLLYTAPGASAALTPVVLTPYQGGWQQGTDIYKTWRATWQRPPSRPRWLEEIRGWSQMQMNTAEDRINMRYAELPDFARECKRYGVSVIELTGWNAGGQDRNYPCHDTDPRLGTLEEFRAAIAECEAMGVHILLFNKFTWSDISTPWYHSELNRYAAKDIFGDPYLFEGYQYNTYTQLIGINTRRFAVMCPVSEKWRQISSNEFSKSVDLGASGILYDENQHHGGAQFCFDPNHGHPVPAFLFSGDNPLAKDFEKVFRERNPEFVMLGEGILDAQTPHYHGTYIRGHEWSVPLHRYIDPRLPIILPVTGHDGRNILNTCLKNRYLIGYEPRNFKGRLTEAPALMAYGNKIDSLRRHYADFLWEGEYRDVLGASVEGAHALYSVFTRPGDGKRAVVVMNTNDREATKVKVSLEGGGTLRYATPEQPELLPYDGSLELPPWGAAVFFEQ